MGDVVVENSEGVAVEWETGWAEASTVHKDKQKEMNEERKQFLFWEKKRIFSCPVNLWANRDGRKIADDSYKR